jgi:hypothetical protein
MDVIACAFILQRPIHVYQKLVFRTKDESQNMKKDVFEDSTISENPPINILFNGINHFEALKPHSAIYISSSSPSPGSTEKKGKKKNTTKKKSPSSISPQLRYRALMNEIDYTDLTKQQVTRKKKEMARLKKKYPHMTLVERIMR